MGADNFKDIIREWIETDLKKSELNITKFLAILKKTEHNQFKASLLKMFYEIMGFNPGEGHSINEKHLKLLLNSIDPSAQDCVFDQKLNLIIKNLETNKRDSVRYFMYNYLKAIDAIEKIKNEIALNRASQWFNLFSLPENSPESVSSAGNSFKKTLSSFVFHMEDLSESSKKKQFIPNFILFDALGQLSYFLKDIQRKKQIGSNVSNLSDLVKAIFENYSEFFEQSFKILNALGYESSKDDFDSMEKNKELNTWMFKFLFKCNKKDCQEEGCQKMIIWRLILDAIIEYFIAPAIFIDGEIANPKIIMDIYQKSLSMLVRTPPVSGPESSFRCGYKFTLY